MDASRFSHTYFSTGVCFLYQNNIILLLITKTPTIFLNFKTRTISVHLAGKSVSLSLYYTLKRFLIINIISKISYKAIVVPEHHTIQAYSSAELKRSYPRYSVYAILLFQASVHFACSQKWTGSKWHPELEVTVKGHLFGDLIRGLLSKSYLH